MSNGQDKLKSMMDNYFDAYTHSSDYKDTVRMEIALKKSEYEEHLDKMWGIYSRGNVRQIVAYQEQLKDIKATGCKVYRNSQGKHKIVIGG